MNEKTAGFVFILLVCISVIYYIKTHKGLMCVHKTVALAHRGACALAPENTLSSFRMAMDIGADGVEFDVTLSKDGVPVVIHDPTLERTTNGKGQVCEKTLAELKELDAGRWFSAKYEGEKIPTLREALLAIRTDRVVDVEIKSYPGDAADKTDRIISEIKKTRNIDTVIISSFDSEVLRRAKEILPEIRTGFTFSEMSPEEVFKRAADIRADFLEPDISSVAGETIDEIIAAGYKAIIWTVNEPSVFYKLKLKKLYAIITGNQDLFKLLR